jgi:hypothetical protein
MTQVEADRDQVMKNALSEIRKLEEEESRRMLQKQLDEETPSFGAEPWRKSRPSRLEQLKDAVTGQLSMTILSQQWSSVVSAVSLAPSSSLSK